MKLDSEDFNSLCKEYVKRVYRYMYARVNNKEIAEDLASVCLMKVIENADSADLERNVNAWIFTIAHNTLIDYYRKYGNQKEVVGIEVEPEEKSRVDTTAHQEFLVNDVLEYLPKLRPIEREVIELTYFGELDADEISQVLDKRKNTIRTIRHRAIKKLRKFLN